MHSTTRIIIVAVAAFCAGAGSGGALIRIALGGQETNANSLSEIDQALSDLADDSFTTRRDAAKALADVHAKVERRLLELLRMGQPESDPLVLKPSFELAGSLAQKYYSSELVRQLVMNVDFEWPEDARSRWDDLADYPLAKALRPLCVSPYVEIMDFLGGAYVLTDPDGRRVEKEPSDKAFDLYARLMTQVHAGGYRKENEYRARADYVIADIQFALASQAKHGNSPAAERYQRLIDAIEKLAKETEERAKVN